MLALPQLVAEHTHFEKKRRGVDAAPDFLEIGRRRARRRVDDFQKAAFELVEHGGHRMLAGIRCILTVEAAGDDQILGPALFRRDVLAGGRVHDVGEYSLGAIEVVGHRCQQDSLACVVSARAWKALGGLSGGSESGRRRAVRRRPPSACHKGRHQQDGKGSDRGEPLDSEPDAPPRDFLFRKPMTDALPDLQAVLVAAFRRFWSGDEPQRPGQRAIVSCAALALIQVDFDVRAAAALAVVMEDQILFGVVLHDSPRSGSRAVRSFRTARKTLCFVALVPSPSVLPISAIDRPSWCRSVNAARSSGVRSVIAVATVRSMRALAASRSGSGDSLCGCSSSAMSSMLAWSWRERRDRIRSTEQFATMR